jgi:uncharacterized protein (TIGR03382 family)
MVLLAIAAPAVAQDFSLVTTLVHPNQRPSNEDRFGSGVAISGGTLLVGAMDEQAANAYSGVVHVFSDVDWAEVAPIKSSVDADIEFGAAVQLDGDRALISNMAIDGGVAWFFEKIEGVWTEKLRVQGLVNEAFGYRLALRGDLAFIAAPRVGTGNVHVYRRVAGTWGETQVLTADDAQDGDFFGYSIAFDGQRLAVSAPGNALGATRSAVYTFSKQGDAFVQEGKLTGDDPATHWFGGDVALSGDTLIVNAPAAYQAMSAGKALVYERRAEQWELASELTVEGEASFPTGLALDGDTAWIGAPGTNPRALNVYAFNRTNGAWLGGQKLNFPDFGEYQIATWRVQDGSLAIGFWNGLRTESVQVYRGAGYQSSSAGSPSGSAGPGGVGGTAATGASGEGSATLGGSSSPSTSGSLAGPTIADPSSGGGSSSESSERGGCGCTLVQSGKPPVWPLLVLAFAISRRRRTPAGRSREASCGRRRCRSADSTLGRWRPSLRAP